MHPKVYLFIFPFILFASSKGLGQVDSSPSLRQTVVEELKIIRGFFGNAELQGYDQNASKEITDLYEQLNSGDDQTISDPIILGKIKQAIFYIELAIKDAEPKPDSGDSDMMQELQSDLEKLKDLQDRQDSLNEQIGKAASQGQTGSPNQDLAIEQKELREELQALRKQRYERSGKLGDVEALDQAGREMEKGEGQLKMNQPGPALPHGEIAADALERAISQVKNELSGIAADLVDQLTSKSGELSQAQSDLKNQTENAGSGQGGELRGEQENLNQQIKDLLEEIDQTARELGKLDERATEGMLEALRQAEEQDLEKSGRRASNSLLYDAFSSAMSEQGKVEEGLENLGNEMQKIEDRLRYGENSGLGELAEHLQKMAEEGTDSGGMEFKESNEEAARMLGNLPHSDTDQRIQNLTRMFEESAFSENINSARSLSRGAVGQASQLIEQFLWQQAVQENFRRNNQNTLAPTRYRKQVEEYFRRIAEGQ